MDNMGMDLQKLLQMGQQMQSRMTEMQERLKNESISARAGGGMVEVAVDGQGTVRQIRLDPEVVNPEDVETLEDLVLAAISEAQRRARERQEEEMKQAAGGFPMPDLGGLLGG